MRENGKEKKWGRKKKRWENRPVCVFWWKKKKKKKIEEEMRVVVCVEKKNWGRVEKWREVGDAPAMSGVWRKN